MMFLFLPLFSFKALETKKTLNRFSLNSGKVIHNTDKGKWIFQMFGEDVIKTTFIPVGYTSNEQVTNAVIQKPSRLHGYKTDGPSPTINFEDIAKIVVKNKKYSYHFGEEEKDVLAESFSEYEYRGFRFKLSQDEQIFGGGERALPMNRRGYGFSLYNKPAYGYGEGTGDLNFSVPFIISSKGYGIFFDNASRGYMDIGRKNADVLEAAFTSGELTFYIINGKNVQDVLKNYTQLVGRQPIPARWIFGNLMSRFGYRSQEEVMETVKKMKKEKFPIDAVILDLFWFGDSIKNTLGNLDWINHQKWPHPEKMIGDLKKQGIKTVLITEPYVLMGTKNYSESKDFHAVDSTGHPYTLTNFFFGFGGLLDLFRKSAQDWFWTKYKKQIEKGIAGWWGDLGEPETHPAEIHHNLSDLGHDRLFRAEEVHNIFGHNWNKMLHEKYQQDYPDVRLFNLNRSGYAGSQRYSVFPWSGDVGRNWSGLRAQMPVMLGMSLSGIPYIHADAGGFAMGEKNPELYTRWLQFAAFTPVFRPHGQALGELDTNVAHIESEPVYYPEPYKSIVRKYIRLRYDLLPYNYNLAYQQAKEGKPLTRPMFYNDAKDTELLKANEQYMWGDRILVAPVLHEGATEKHIYLPKGKWYKYFCNTKVFGGHWIKENVNIDNIPLFVKAGSFIPVRRGIDNTEDYPCNTLQVTYYPDAAHSSYVMYDDDGKTNMSLETNRYELLKFEATMDHKKYYLQMSSNGGEFTGKPSVRTITLSVPGLIREPLGIKLNDHAVSIENHNHLPKDLSSDVRATWDSLNSILHVAFPFTGDTRSIEIIK